MELDQGMSVYTADGRKVGTIDRVVIDPRTEKISHIVVRKGLLFVEDKVVPVDLLNEASADGVVLRPNVGNLDELPAFEETHYLPLYELDNRPADPSALLYYYPPVGIASGNMGGFFTPEPPYIVETERNVPQGYLVLKEGSRVISRDDKHVGNVERIFANSRDARVTHLLISQGLLLKERKLIPVYWVDHVYGDEVHLTVNSQLLDRLPAYKGNLDIAAV